MTTQPPWIAQAYKYLGAKEVAGQVDNPTIVRFFKLAGHSWVQDDETPWCAAFVAAMLAECKINNEVPVPERLTALAYKKLGQRLNSPAYGCIGVKTRKGGGHVGFIVGSSGNVYSMLGGNQANMVSIANYPKSEFVAYRWPSGFKLPTDIGLPHASGVRGDSQA